MKPGMEDGQGHTKAAAGLFYVPVFIFECPSLTPPPLPPRTPATYSALPTELIAGCVSPTPHRSGYIQDSPTYSPHWASTTSSFLTALYSPYKASANLPTSSSIEPLTFCPSLCPCPKLFYLTLGGKDKGPDFQLHGAQKVLMAAMLNGACHKNITYNYVTDTSINQKSLVSVVKESAH